MSTVERLGMPSLAAKDSGVDESCHLQESVMLGPSVDYPPSFWEPSFELISDIKRFLRGLNAKEIGNAGGVVTYDQATFTLTPRSQYFSSPSLQRAVNMFDPRATFENTQKGFLALKEKVDTLKRKIKHFNPKKPQDCSEDARLMLMQLIVIENDIIEDIAKKGLEQLCENYRSQQKNDNASSLGRIGRAVFEEITGMSKIFAQKIKQFIKDIDDDISLAAFNLTAKEILKPRDKNRQHLLDVRLGSSQGCVVIPMNLINDCLRDLEQKRKTSRPALRNAVNYIHYPKRASIIPVKMGAGDWTPLRPIHQGKQIKFERGVTGTSERDEARGDRNICNLYYLKKDHELVISCGAIDTQIKAEQLAASIQKASEGTSSANGRYVLHQLNSYKTEGPLLERTHALRGYTEKCLQRIEAEATLTHINTAINAATLFSGEDEQSLRKINIDALAGLAQFALEDINQLFSMNPILSALKTTEDHPFKRLDALVSTVSQCANSIKRMKGEGGIPQQAHSEIEIGESMMFNQIALNNPVEELTEADVDINLKSLQESLKNSLLTIIGLIQETVETLSGLSSQLDAKGQSALRQAILLLNVLGKNLKMQFKVECEPPLSRCGEIELLFLLYKLLKMRIIIICRSGLDRSAIARALYQSLSYLETLFLKDAMGFGSSSQMSMSGGLPALEAPSDTAKEELTASERIYQLILKQDRNRDQLFDYWNQIVHERSLDSYLLEDFYQLQNMSTSDQRDLHLLLLQKIDEMGTPNDADQQIGRVPLTPIQVKELQDALLYQELVTYNLLAVESIKPLSSTGAVGFKWLHDANLAWRRFANFHPLQRLSMFIHYESDGKRLPIRILNYAPTVLGYTVSLPFADRIFSKSISFTTAGIQLFSRLSQLRGS